MSFKKEGVDASLAKWLDALKLMRIPFSFFLMPVYWFALIYIDVNVEKAIWVFITLHLFVYPASNGYNSYFDRDENSIGGLKKPPKVTSALWYLVVLFDLLSLWIAIGVNLAFAAMIFIYMLVSKAYSWDKIRLKKYPVTGALTVTFFQGFFTYLAVQVGCAGSDFLNAGNLTLAMVSSLFLLGSYPLTQIYQHSEDAKRGDRSLSILLGLRGTFIFSLLSFFVAGVIMLFVFIQNSHIPYVIVFLIATLPVNLFFFYWYRDYLKGKSVITFDRTMRMNAISSIMLSVAFIVMIFFK